MDIKVYAFNSCIQEAETGRSVILTPILMHREPRPARDTRETLSEKQNSTLIKIKHVPVCPCGVSSNEYPIIKTGLG